MLLRPVAETAICRSDGNEPPSGSRTWKRTSENPPSRFASDTGRLLKVLDRTLAEVRTEHDDAASMREPAEKAPAPA